MNLENLLSQIYSDRKEYIIPFILGFPAVYAVFAFTPELAKFSYFDRVVFSLAIEVAFHSAVISVLQLLYDWRLESSTSLASANIYATVIIYGIARLWSWTSSVSLFFLFLFGTFIGSILGVIIFQPRRIRKLHNTEQAHPHADEKGRNARPQPINKS